jgi:hypothetical protein
VGLSLENWNLEKMQHVMQKKWILKMQTKSNCRKKMQKKGNHKCTKNANAKTQCKTNRNKK